jgi:hypothetical protein
LETTLDEITLDNAVVLRDEPVLDSFRVRSVRTGKRFSNNAGKHWLFQVKIHLFKYADAETTYLLLKSFEGTEVLLYRHADGEPIYDTYGNAGRFILTFINEDYLFSVDDPDILILTFESVNYIKQISAVPSASSSYLMNDILDTPVGSYAFDLVGDDDTYIYEINHIKNPSIYEATKHLRITSGAVPVSINGYKAFRAYNEMVNCYYKDILDGLTDITFIISFRKGTAVAASHANLFNHDSTDYATRLRLYMPENSGTLIAKMSNENPPINSALAQTTLEYDDGAPHIVVVQFNQTAKRVTIITDQGEKISNENSSFASNILTTALEGQPQLLYRQNPGGDGYPGGAGYLFGTSDDDSFLSDVFFFDGIIVASEINAVCNWIANRLNISWDNTI